MRLYRRSGSYTASPTRLRAGTLLTTSTLTSAVQIYPDVSATDPDLSHWPPKTTTGLYVTTTGPSAINYTNGSSVGAAAAQNGDLRINQGAGKSYPFGSTFQPRIWNGTIHYTATIPTPNFTVTKTPDVASVNAAGNVINYTIAVTNTGNVTLTGITIADPLTGNEACPATTLAVGAPVMNCTASYTVQQSDIDDNGIDTTGAADGDGDIDNTVTVDTAQTAPKTASAAVAITQTPNFTVTKTPDVASVNAAGNVINYTIAVTNTGNVTLTGITIADPLTGNEACPATTLAVGAPVMNCTASYTVQQSDIDDNGIDTTGAADGDGDIDNTVTVRVNCRRDDADDRHRPRSASHSIARLVTVDEDAAGICHGTSTPPATSSTTRSPS